MEMAPSRSKVLSAAFVRTVTKPGRYGDGRGGYGLTLLVKPMVNGRVSKTWAQRLRFSGRPTNLGLGKYPIVSLAEARAKALANARAVVQGRDPRAEKRMPSFAEAVEAVIQLHEPTWKAGAKTAVTWRTSLRDHAIPKLGRRRVDEITVTDVLDVLTPIWHSKPELSRKLRQRMSTIFKWAIAQRYRQDDPAGPAISAALPRNGSKVQHLRALPHREVCAALATVDRTQAWPLTKHCFRVIALTAVRSGEARLATWDEVDLESATWTIPAERMKTGREHRVPLSPEAVQVFKAAEVYRDRSGLVFASQRGKAMTDSTVSKLLRENGVQSTVHGFRSSFRDWCADTGQPREIAEAALAHVVGGVEGAYFRSDLFERRREVMDAWSTYVSGTIK